MEMITYSPPNILVVDDVNANLIVLTDMLRSSGYVPRPVTNVKQAIDAIEALTPNLILLDISMPDIDGYEFCNMLKKNAKTRDIPIIFISALNTTESKVKGFRAGAVDYIDKPFEIEELALRINSHIKMHKIIQELEVYNKKLYKIINDQIQKIYDNQKNLILTLAKLSTEQDAHRKMHMERVGKNCRLLAMGMQLSTKYRGIITNSFIDAIELASMLHDFGKASMDGDQLYRQEELTEQIRQAITRHTLEDAVSIEEIFIYNENNEFLKMALEIIQNHHEFWNGRGFPSGTSAQNIPLSARIVAVIDAYDILTNDYGTKQRYTHERSMEIINEKAGTIFDPDIVEVLNKVQYQLKK